MRHQRSWPSPSFHIPFTVSLTLIPPNSHSLLCLPQCEVVPDVFLIFLNVAGRDGLAGWDGEVGEMAGSEPIRSGWLGGSGGEVGSSGVVLMEVGGGFRGDLDMERNMLSVVAARVIDRG